MFFINFIICLFTCGINFILHLFKGVLWVSVVLNPSCGTTEKAGWVERLRSWSELPICPLEEGSGRMPPANFGTHQHHHHHNQGVA